MRIENSLQYVRDVTKGSDRSQLRSGNAPQIMAALCNLVITLIHHHWSDQIAITRRQFAYHPCQALKLLLHKRRSQQSFTDPGSAVLTFWGYLISSSDIHRDKAKQTAI